MTAPDTIDLSLLPFYQWDSIPYNTEAEAPDAGLATDSCYRQLLVCDSSVVNNMPTRPSLFTGHSFAQRHDTLLTRTDSNAPVWIFAMLLVLVALVTLYFRQHKLRFTDLLQSLVDSRAMDRMLRNNNLTRTAQLIPTGLLMISCLMLPVALMALGKSGITGYLLLTLAVAVAYLLRNGLMHLLGTIFDNEGAVTTYITSNYLYHLTLATFSLPLLFLAIYLPNGQDVVLKVLLGLVLLELVVRLFRGLKLFLTQSTNAHVYLFYYLCIAELAPILVLVKWIIE